MSFILSDTGKKVAVALKYYPWFLFCLSCSDVSISAVTAFPKSLCFISKHRQLLHKICIALVAFFWLFNWSSLKLSAQNFSEVVCEDCAFSMQCRMENKQEVSMWYLFFLFPLFFATGKCFDYRHPSFGFSSELLFCCLYLLRCRTLFSVSLESPGVWVRQGYVWEVIRNWVSLGSMDKLQRLVWVGISCFWVCCLF